MREAVGSSFLFQIMIIFIFFFAAFMAIAINYSQAFQTKNKIINAIEQAEGYNATSRKTLEDIKSTTGYFRGISDDVCKDKLGDGAFVAKSTLNADLKGMCIKRNETASGSYYTVSTFIWFNFPIIGDIATIPVKGETKLIVNDSYEK